MVAKYVTASLGSRKLYLAFTVSAMFQINDALGKKELFAVLTGEKEDFETFCEVVRILSCCGETIRQQEGYEKQKPLTTEQLAANMLPVEYLGLKKAAMDAVLIGYGREVEEEQEEIDLGLAELEKKENRPERTC